MIDNLFLRFFMICYRKETPNYLILVIIQKIFGTQLVLPHNSLPHLEQSLVQVRFSTFRVWKFGFGLAFHSSGVMNYVYNRPAGIRTKLYLNFSKICENLKSNWQNLVQLIETYVALQTTRTNYSSNISVNYKVCQQN